MKSSKHILSYLTKQSQFDSLTEHSCYRKFMEMLPPRFQQAIAFVYVKNRTLFVALSHPGYKMELNYNKELFKDLLATLGQHLPECSYDVSSVILFDSKYQLKKELREVPESEPHYSELSSAEFEMDIEDEELREKFAYSKKLILRNINLRTGH